MKGKLLKQGAEAKLFLVEYMGRKAMLKVREKKSYRTEELDRKILMERLRTECTLLSRAKNAGVRTPVIWKIDQVEGAITTEFIEGRTLKEELKKEPGNSRILCAEAGQNIARLHSNDLVHGDLTTGNMILHDGRLVLIDFGLGQLSGKIEDKAVDLLVFKKTFMATHFSLAGYWKGIEGAYARNYTKGRKVLGQMRRVEARARYYEG